MMLLSSTYSSTFGQTVDNTIITDPMKKPIHKSLHMPYIIDSMDNGVCSLTFMRALDNVEIRIYQNGILIDQNFGSFKEGETCTLDLQKYGEGKYSIEDCSGNKIFSSSEEI